MYLFILISHFNLETDYWIDWHIYILCDTKYAIIGNINFHAISTVSPVLQ